MRSDMRALRTQWVDQSEPAGLQSTGRPVMLHGCRKPADSQPDPNSSFSNILLRRWAACPGSATAADPVESPLRCRPLSKPNQTRDAVSPSSTLPRECVCCGCVWWSLVSVYSGERPDQLACDAWCAALWSTTATPPRMSHRGPATPFPRRAAETAASPRQMEHPAFPVSLLQAKKRLSERWRWDWPWPLSQMPGEGWGSGRGPAERVLGRNRCNLSPSIPSVSTSVVEPALSSCPRSFSFTHSGGVVGLHPTPPSAQQQIQTPKIPAKQGFLASLHLPLRRSKQ